MSPRGPRHDISPVDAGDAAIPGEERQGERLQKILAAAGLGSRRQCEELILAGRVEVDREVVLELGTRVDPGRQSIRVDGQPLARPRRVHYLVNKPPGVVCTNNDPAGRPRVIDLIPARDGRRLFTVGRLDLSSEGLILATNDGELANLLTHPRYGVEKTYQVLVAGAVDFEELARLKNGIFLAEGFARVVRFTVKVQRKKSTLLEIVLNEGRNREIRRLLARVGHKVLSLKRVAIGGVKLGTMQPGEARPLRPDELKLLRDAVHVSRRGRRVAPQRRPRSATKGESAQAPAQEPPFAIELPRRGAHRHGKAQHGKPQPGKPATAAVASSALGKSRRTKPRRPLGATIRKHRGGPG